MNFWRSKRIAILAAVIAILAYANLKVINSTVEISPIKAVENGANPAPAPTDAKLPGLPEPRQLSEFKQTVTRPIFATDRRPVERKPKAEISSTLVAAEAVPKQLQLIGVIKGEKARALIRSNTSAQGTWMSIGEDIDGWRLREVADNAATIETHGHKYQLFLYPGAGAN